MPNGSLSNNENNRTRFLNLTKTHYTVPPKHQPRATPLVTALRHLFALLQANIVLTSTSRRSFALTRLKQWRNRAKRGKTGYSGDSVTDDGADGRPVLEWYGDAAMGAVGTMLEPRLWPNAAVAAVSIVLNGEEPAHPDGLAGGIRLGWNANKHGTPQAMSRPPALLARMRSRPVLPGRIIRACGHRGRGLNAESSSQYPPEDRGYDDHICDQHITNHPWSTQLGVPSVQLPIPGFRLHVPGYKPPVPDFVMFSSCVVHVVSP